MFKLHTTNSHDDDDDDENIVAQLSFFPNAVYKLISAQYGLQWLVSSFANTLWGGGALSANQPWHHVHNIENRHSWN